jgi:hypothetical protein
LSSSGQPSEPMIDAISVELLQLDSADLWHQVLLDENPVRLDGSLIKISAFTRINSIDDHSRFRTARYRDAVT